MQRTVADLIYSVSGLLTGTNLDNVTNLYGAFQRAARTVVQRANIPESNGRMGYTVYDGVTDYAAPASIFGGSILDFRPQGVSRTPNEFTQKTPIETFDRTKAYVWNGVEITFEWRAGVPVMRVAGSRAAQKLVMSTMSVTTGWVASGNASGLAVDYQTIYQSPASLRFNVSGAGASILTKTYSNPINMSAYQGVGVQFLAIKTPSASALSSIELRVGSDANNYVTLTQSAGFLGAWTTDDFILVAFDLSLGTTVLSPDFTKISYSQIIINTTAAMANFHVGYLFASLPCPYTLIFESAAMFRDPNTGALLQNIVDTNTQIVCTDASYTLLEYECAIAVAIQTGGSYSQGIVSEYGQILNGTRTRTGGVVQYGLYDQYRADNPSEEIRTVGSWYDDQPTSSW